MFNATFHHLGVPILYLYGRYILEHEGNETIKIEITSKKTKTFSNQILKNKIMNVVFLPI
jgi:hypothetical protein